jgi:methyl-accepting chemotaxis protein
MHTGRKSISLATKITLMALMAILLSTIPIGIFAHNVYKRDLVANYGERALAIAHSFAVFIDPDEFLWAMETLQKNDYFNDLQQKRDKMAESTGALFLFAGVADESIGLITFMEDYTLDLGKTFPKEVFPPEFFDAQRLGVPGATGVIYTGVDDFYAVCAYVPIFDASNNPIGITGVNINVNDMLQNSYNFASTMVIIVGLVVVLIAWIPVFWVRRYVGKPIRSLRDTFNKIADGDMDVKVSYSSNDEIGELAHSFRLMQMEVSTVINETQICSREIINGNTAIAKSTYKAKGDFQRIIESIENVANHLHTTS